MPQKRAVGAVAERQRTGPEQAVDGVEIVGRDRLFVTLERGGNLGDDAGIVDFHDPVSCLPRRLFVEHGDAIDLDVDAGAMRRAADAGPRHLLTLHELSERRMGP